MRPMALRRTRADADESAPSAGRPAIDYGPLEQRLGYVLRRAQIAVFRDFFESFAAFDIRPGQYSILTVIERNPALTQSAVSEALGIKRTNFVAMIDELEARKLVRRNPAPHDRRSYALMVTDKGKRLMTELHAVAEQHERRIADVLGAETRRRLFAPLNALARMGEGVSGES